MPPGKSRTQYFIPDSSDGEEQADRTIITETSSSPPRPQSLITVSTKATAPRFKTRCTSCIRKKSKCPGGTPCSNCSTASECVYELDMRYLRRKSSVPTIPLALVKISGADDTAAEKEEEQQDDNHNEDEVSVPCKFSIDEFCFIIRPKGYIPGVTEQHVVFASLPASTTFSNPYLAMQSWASTQSKQTVEELVDANIAWTVSYNDWVRTQPVSRGRVRAFLVPQHILKNSRTPSSRTVFEMTEWPPSDLEAFRGFTPEERLFISNATIPRKDDCYDTEVLPLRILVPDYGNRAVSDGKVVCISFSCDSVERARGDTDIVLIWLDHRFVISSMAELLAPSCHMRNTSLDLLQDQLRGGPYWTLEGTIVRWFYLCQSPDCATWAQEREAADMETLQEALLTESLKDRDESRLRKLGELFDEALG